MKTIWLEIKVEIRKPFFWFIIFQLILLSVMYLYLYNSFKNFYSEFQFETVCPN